MWAKLKSWNMTFHECKSGSNTHLVAQNIQKKKHTWSFYFFFINNYTFLSQIPFIDDWCRVRWVKSTLFIHTNHFFKAPWRLGKRYYRSKSNSDKNHDDIYYVIYVQLQYIVISSSPRQTWSSLLSSPPALWRVHWWDGGGEEQPGGIQSHWNWPSFNPLTTSHTLPIIVMLVIIISTIIITSIIINLLCLYHVILLCL